MSTRAIIAIPTEKGYKTAWCWNDGFPDNLGRILRTKFKTKELADELVGHHSFSCLMTAKEVEEHKEWRKKNGIGVNDWDIKYIVLSNGCVLLSYPYNGKTVAGKGKYGFFSNIEDMLGQDLNYVYVFEEETGKWKMYK